jgi:hypothetical protein
MKSTKFSLNLSDGAKAFILAVGIPVLTTIQQLIPDWTQWLTVHFNGNVALIFQATLSAIITYLTKNFLTNDTKTAVKTIEKHATDTVVIEPKNVR